MKKIFCDSCGRETNTEWYIVTIRGVTFELCTTCAAQLKSFLRNMFKTVNVDLLIEKN